MVANATDTTSLEMQSASSLPCADTAQVSSWARLLLLCRLWPGFASLAAFMQFLVCQKHIIIRVRQHYAFDAQMVFLCFQRHKLDMHDNGHPTDLSTQMCKDDDSAARASTSHCLGGTQAPATDLGIPAGLELTPTAATQPTPTSSKVRSPQQTDWRQHLATLALDSCCPCISSRQFCC